MELSHNEGELKPQVTMLISPLRTHIQLTGNIWTSQLAMRYTEDWEARKVDYPLAINVV